MENLGLNRKGMNKEKSPVLRPHIVVQQETLVKRCNKLTCCGSEACVQRCFGVCRKIWKANRSHVIKTSGFRIKLMVISDNLREPEFKFLRCYSARIHARHILKFKWPF